MHHKLITRANLPIPLFHGFKVSFKNGFALVDGWLLEFFSVQE
jgi:hypothetical protein